MGDKGFDWEQFAQGMGYSPEELAAFRGRRTTSLSPNTPNGWTAGSSSGR